MLAQTGVILAAVIGLSRRTAARAWRPRSPTPAGSNTRRTYRAQWERFADWCERHGRASLPASTASVADHPAERATATKTATVRLSAAVPAESKDTAVRLADALDWEHGGRRLVDLAGSPWPYGGRSPPAGVAAPGSAGRGQDGLAAVRGESPGCLILLPSLE